MWVGFIKKKNLNKKLRILRFCQRLRLDGIQKDDQNIDGVDRFHQHLQSLHSPIPLPGSTFNSVTLDSFDLYAV